MKVEPRQIKKALKYAVACTCVATALAVTGCNEEVVLSGDVPYTPVESDNVEENGG